MSSLLESRDLQQAHETYRSIQRCQHTPITEQELQRHVSGIDKMRNDPDHGHDWSGFLEGEEERTVKLWNQCRELHKVREQIWGSELFDRAANGDPFARFLYAMWAPRERDSVVMTTEDLLAYESTALDFTLRNIEEGHPLGLLALGLSRRGHRYFTAGRGALGDALLIAAELCSNGAFGLQPMIDEMIEQREQFQYQGHGATTVEILEMSTRLYDAHCATSIARTQDTQP